MRILALVLLPALVAVAACDSSKKAPPPANGGSAMAGGQLPPGHPPMGGLPPGHPPMGGQMGSQMGGTGMPTAEPMGAAASSPVTWTVPEGWEQTPPANAMRIAQFTVAASEGGPVECVIFGGIGGTADQNIQRWIGQFGEGASDSAKVTELAVNGLEVKRLDVSGQFGGGMSPDGHSGGAGYRMLAAVIEGAAGPVQLKFVGPSDVVARHEAAFDALVKSLAPAN